MLTFLPTPDNISLFFYSSRSVTVFMFIDYLSGNAWPSFVQPRDCIAQQFKRFAARAYAEIVFGVGSEENNDQ